MTLKRNNPTQPSDEQRDRAPELDTYTIKDLDPDEFADQIKGGRAGRYTGPNCIW